MEWSDAIITALIAALVAVGTALITYRATVTTLVQQWDLHERDLSRRFTEKLYDLRLASYPKAFEITDRLRGDLVFSENLSEETLQGVREELLIWNRTSAGFLMSPECLKSFYAIRDALTVRPDNGKSYSKPQKKGIWTCKNRFRGFLKSDLNLLYQEEQEPKG